MGRSLAKPAFETALPSAGMVRASSETWCMKRGAGLTNIADRLDALGGELQINSMPLEGTTSTGSIEVPVVAPQSGMSSYTEGAR